MTGLPDDTLWSVAWMSASFVLSCVLTALAIRYARRNNVLDLPGQRRSHSVPTPRGGGIGIVVCVLLSLMLLPWISAGAEWPLRLIVAVALIAAIGWIDDHRPLPAWLRFLVQLIAVLVWLLPLWAAVFFAPADPARQLGTSLTIDLGVVLLLLLVTLWSINLHNFMDGIDGLLGWQAVFVLSALTLLAWRETGSSHPPLLGIWAAAVAGFLPFNFPRARVFMGDVGSGVLGLLIAVAAIWLNALPATAQASALIAVSAFATDATCTLLSRMLSGRRWYSAHREHLYQWMARSGMSHARVVAWYMAWNLLIVAPLLYWINQRLEARVGPASAGYGWAAALYALSVTLWICGKRWCLRRVRAKQGSVAIGALHASS